MNRGDYRLKVCRFGIDTHQEHVVYMRQDCHVCRSEGFTVQARIKITIGGRSILATLNSVEAERLAHDEFGLSESAWRALAATDGELATFAHAPPVESMGAVREPPPVRRNHRRCLRRPLHRRRTLRLPHRLRRRAPDP